MSRPEPSPPGAFLRLWAAMFFTYFAVKLIFNLGVLGFIDLTPAAFLELACVPLGQSVLFWFLTRRQRARPSVTPPIADPAR